MRKVSAILSVLLVVVLMNQGLALASAGQSGKKAIKMNFGPKHKHAAATTPAAKKA